MYVGSYLKATLMTIRNVSNFKVENINQNFNFRKILVNFKI